MSKLMQDAYHPETDGSVSGVDPRQILSGSSVHTHHSNIGTQIPFGEIGLITLQRTRSWETGMSMEVCSSYSTPYRLSVTEDVAKTGNSFMQANLVRDPNPQHPPAQWLVGSAFQSRAPFTLGNLPHSAIPTEYIEI